MEKIVLIFHMWNARRKARSVAEAEAFNLLRDFDPQILQGGPLSEKKGVFWIAISPDGLDQAKKRFPRLGYTQFVDLPLVVPESELPVDIQKARTLGEIIRWRKQYHKLSRVYAASVQTMLDSAPDQREFMLKLADDDIRPVKGYRGDGNALSRRGLPPYDARMLVNLVCPEIENAVFLDPFAGVGGILLEAIASGHQAFSIDIDPFLMYGLQQFGKHHCTADSQNLPYKDASIDAIATEPPYDKVAEEIVIFALAEMVRVLKYGSRMAVFCANWQAEGLRQASQSLELECYLDAPVNRKGTACVVLAWRKS